MNDVIFGSSHSIAAVVLYWMIPNLQAYETTYNIRNLIC